MFGKYVKSEQRKFLYNKWILIVMTGLLVFIPVMVSSLNAFAGEEGYLLICFFILKNSPRNKSYLVRSSVRKILESAVNKIELFVLIPYS